MKYIISSIIGTILIFSPMYITKILPHSKDNILFWAYMLVMLVALIGSIIAGGVSLVLIIYKLIKRKQQNILQISLALILLTFSLNYFIFGKIQGALPTGSDILIFNTEIWKAKESTEFVENDISKREKMLFDLVNNVLPGKNKEEIETLLGPSLETNYFKSVDKDLIYYMGIQRDSLMAIDSEWLLIWLDKEGKFKKFEIYND